MTVRTLEYILADLKNQILLLQDDLERTINLPTLNLSDKTIEVNKILDKLVIAELKLNKFSDMTKDVITT